MFKSLKRYFEPDPIDKVITIHCDGCGGVLPSPPETRGIMHYRDGGLIYSPGPCQIAANTVAWNSDKDDVVIRFKKISYKKALRLYKQGQLKQSKFIGEKVIRYATEEIRKKLLEDPNFDPDKKGILVGDDHTAREIYEQEVLPRTKMGMDFIILHLAVEHGMKIKD